MIGALVHAAAAFDLPLSGLRSYVASMRMDCGRLRIQTRDELDRYMEGSGGSVGRIMASILGAPAEAERLARLGVAFQLTNFLRDVREDYGLDRIYLPADERERLGVERRRSGGRHRLARTQRRSSPAEVQRARGLFAETTPTLIEAIPSARRGIGLARTVYASVLDRIERNGFDVLGRGTRPRLWDLARAVALEPTRRPENRSRGSGRTYSSAARASPVSRSRASSPGAAPTSSSSTATRSARTRRRPARCRCRGSGRSGWRTRSGRSFRS